jgi:hypothetical protein
MGFLTFIAIPPVALLLNFAYGTCHSRVGGIEGGWSKQVLATNTPCHVTNR